jgi:hypothetical protein
LGQKWHFLIPPENHEKMPKNGQNLGNAVYEKSMTPQYPFLTGRPIKKTRFFGFFSGEGKKTLCKTHSFAEAPLLATRRWEKRT